MYSTKNVFEGIHCSHWHTKRSSSVRPTDRSFNRPPCPFFPSPTLRRSRSSDRFCPGPQAESEVHYSSCAFLPFHAGRYLLARSSFRSCEMLHIPDWVTLMTQEKPDRHETSPCHPFPGLPLGTPHNSLNAATSRTTPNFPFPITRA